LVLVVTLAKEGIISRMAHEELENTRKMKINGENQENSEISDHNSTKPVKIRKPRCWLMILVGILIILLFGAAGGGFGYLKGIRDRVSRQSEEALKQAAIQFQYGIQQLNSGNYELAKTHFEFVLQTYPDFPGITEKYTETMVKLAELSQPTSTPMPTPTVDNRGVEALFNQAVQEVQTQQWAQAMDTLEALRNADINYRTLEVDGLYFTALRYRAVQQMIVEGDLEEGLYLTTLLSRYAPLDRDIMQYSNWARLYLTGASFWDINWEQVLLYFSDLYAAFPNMHDGSGYTATDRFMIASEYYADQLVADGDYCGALKYYENVLNISGIESVMNKYNDAYKVCYPPTPIPSATSEPDTDQPPVDDQDTDTPEATTPPPEDTEPPPVDEGTTEEATETPTE